MYALLVAYMYETAESNPETAFLPPSRTPTLGYDGPIESVGIGFYRSLDPYRVQFLHGLSVLTSPFLSTINLLSSGSNIR
jgi:hypothetical protein